MTVPQGIVIVDYGMGNLRSVQKAFEICGAKTKITSNPKEIEKASKIVLPGVGAFTHAMHELKNLKLVKPLQNKIRTGTPYFGICLGLQLLFSESREGGRVKGLNVIPGPVKRFSCRLKIPHMGWNTIHIEQKSSPVFRGIKDNDYFYFVHSYFGVPEDKSWILSRTSYGQNFVSSVARDSVFAFQFHPEKSQASGLRIIKNFIEYQPREKGGKR